MTSFRKPVGLLSTLNRHPGESAIGLSNLRPNLGTGTSLVFTDWILRVETCPFRNHQLAEYVTFIFKTAGTSLGIIYSRLAHETSKIRTSN